MPNVCQTSTNTLNSPALQEVVAHQKRIVLAQGQFCVVLDPVDDKHKPQLGHRQLRVGCDSFFLHPGMLCLEWS